jgi:hypothetical protein
VTCIELGPMDHTETRPGIDRSRDLHRARPHGSHRIPARIRSIEGPASSSAPWITPKPRPGSDRSSDLHRARPAADRNCNPARCVLLDESRPGSDPSSDLHRVPARSGSKLQPVRNL